MPADSSFDLAMNEALIDGIVSGRLKPIRFPDESHEEWFALAKDLIVQALTNTAHSETERLERALKVVQHML